MDIKTKCLTVSAIDIGENDKLVTVLTEAGDKLKIKLKGVKKAAAKFKFAAQPFCFMECVLHRNGDFYTLISADGIDSFGEILSDLDKLFAAYVVLETADKLSVSGGSLAETLKALRAVCYNECAPLEAVCIFMSRYLIMSGYHFELSRCIECGRAVTVGAHAVLSLSGGGVKCGQCIREGDRTVKKSSYENLLKVRGADYENPPVLSPGEQKTLIGIYTKIALAMTGEEIRSVGNIMKLK